MDVNKKLTVVMWDNNYRETLADSLYCLSKLNNLEELEFIFIEWGNKVNPEVLKYDFIKVICVNSTQPFDTGAQWNLGLFLAKTNWVAYNHCDLMPPDHYEKILREINKVENKDIVWFEGWNINNNGGIYSQHPHYVKLKKQLNNETHLLTDYYKKQNNVPYNGRAGNSFTIKKNEFIKLVDGWPWNINTWYWCGPAYKNKKLPNNLGIRKYLKSIKKSNCKLPEIYVFNIPHKRGDNHKKHTGNKNQSNVKYYSDFVNNVLPQQNLTKSKDINKK